MATYELRNGQGSIFKNDKKGNDKAPDYRGNGMIHDKEVSFALWLKESDKGLKYFSVKIEDKEQSQETSAKPAEKEEQKKAAPEGESDLPF